MPETDLLLRLLDIGVGMTSLIVLLIMAMVLLRMVRIVMFALEGQQHADESDQKERRGFLGMIEQLITKFGLTLDAIKESFEEQSRLAQERFDRAVSMMATVPRDIHALSGQVSETSALTIENRGVLTEIMSCLTDLKMSIDMVPTSHEIGVVLSGIRKSCDTIEAKLDIIEKRITDGPRPTSKQPGVSGELGDQHRGTVGGSRDDDRHRDDDYRVRSMADQDRTKGIPLERDELRGTKSEDTTISDGSDPDRGMAVQPPGTEPDSTSEPDPSGASVESKVSDRAEPRPTATIRSGGDPAGLTNPANRTRKSADEPAPEQDPVRKPRDSGGG